VECSRHIKNTLQRFRYLGFITLNKLKDK